MACEAQQVDKREKALQLKKKNLKRHMARGDAAVILSLGSRGRRVECLQNRKSRCKKSRAACCSVIQEDLGILQACLPADMLNCSETACSGAHELTCRGTLGMRLGCNKRW